MIKMGQNEDVVKVTNVFIKLPKKEFILIGIVLFGLIFGVLYESNNLFYGMVKGFFLLTLPALILTILMKITVRNLLLKRILAISFISELIYGISYLIYFKTTVPFKESMIFIGAAIAFVLMYIISQLVFILKWRSWLFSLIQLFIYFLFLTAYGSIENAGIIKFLISSIILLLFLKIFLFIINSPMKKNFGVKTTDVIESFMAQWFYNSKELEKELEKIAQKMKLLFGAIVFKRKDDEIVLYYPYVHFGPFGNIGGSNFSYLIPKKIGKKGVVFHTTVTHDLDPVASKEVEKIKNAFYNGYKKIEFGEKKCGFIKEGDEERIEGIVLEDIALLSLTREPKTTEDLTYGLGAVLMKEGEKKWKDVFIADQHNAETGEVVYYGVGSEVGEKYLDVIKKLKEKKIKENELKIGFAEEKIKGPFGPAGLKVVVFSTIPKYAMIVFDANGIKPKALNELKEYIKQHFDGEFGIFTTDTHKINKEKGVLNPITDVSNIKEVVLKTIKNAEKDMKKAKVGVIKEFVDIEVIGSNQSSEIVSTVNSIVSIVKIAAPLTLLAGIITILYVISKI